MSAARAAGVSAARAAGVSAAGAAGMSAAGAAGVGAAGAAGVGAAGAEDVGAAVAPASVDPLDLESQICFALSVASRSVVAAYRPVLEPLGLTHPQYLVMLALWQHAPLSGRGLSRLLRLDPGTLSPLLKRLEAQGLLTRERRADDERALSIELTPEGAALRREAEGIPGRMMARLGVTHDELAVLHRTMTKLIVAADAEGVAAPA